MAKSSIEWTCSTWNPVTGCTKISPGCQNCYAERMAKRLQAMGNPNYHNGFKVTPQPSMLGHPLKWKTPQRIFVNSMSDLFHDEVDLDYIQRVFDVISRAHWHQFQVLTKRAERLLELSEKLDWPKNLWMGVSVENQQATYRIDYLRKTGASIKFLSIEPLIGPIKKIDLSGIDWVIVGGESGPKSRPMKKEWVIEILDACDTKKIPFFFKQWGGINKKKAGRELDNKIYNGIPVYA